MDNSLKNYLEKAKVNYKLEKHPAFFTVEESKKYRSFTKLKGMHCKTLFLKDDNGRFYLVGMEADARLDIKKLQIHLGVKKLKFASSDELLRETTLKPGSVSIFGAIYSKNLKLIIGRRVWAASSVGFHPNINTETLELSHKDLENYYNSLENDKEIVSL